MREMEECYEKGYSKCHRIIIHILSSITITKAENSGVKIAFIRHHDLWIKVDGKENNLQKESI